MASSKSSARVLLPSFLPTERFTARRLAGMAQAMGALAVAAGIYIVNSGTREESNCACQG